MTVLTSLDCPMASDPDDVLKNSQPKYSYQLIYLICVQRNFVFQIIGNYYLQYLCLRMLGNIVKKLWPRKSPFYCKESFQNLINNRLADHHKKYGIFSNFQYDNRFSRSAADLLTFVTIRIARTRNRSGTAGAAALTIFKAFDRILHLVFLTTQVLQKFDVGFSACMFISL